MLPLLYIDKNPWGRTLDNQAIARNAAEAQAMGRLVEMLQSGTVRLTYSSVSFGEGGSTVSESAARIALREVISLGLRDLPLITHSADMADTAMVSDFLQRERGISGYDAIHAAAAILEGAWYFVTGDDALRKRLNGLYDDWRLPYSAATPPEVVRAVERGAPLE